MNLNAACAEALSRVMQAIELRARLARREIKLMAERARERINRSAGQHTRYMREGKSRK